VESLPYVIVGWVFLGSTSEGQPQSSKSSYKYTGSQVQVQQHSTTVGIRCGLRLKNLARQPTHYAAAPCVVVTWVIWLKDGLPPWLNHMTIFHHGRIKSKEQTSPVVLQIMRNLNQGYVSAMLTCCDICLQDVIKVSGAGLCLFTFPHRQTLYGGLFHNIAYFLYSQDQRDKYLLLQ